MFQSISAETVFISGTAFLFAVVVALLTARTIRLCIQSRQREESRREVAAYVAEGTISPDDADRILRAPLASVPATAAGKVKDRSADTPGPDGVIDKLAAAVADWGIEEEDAKLLANARNRLGDAHWAKAVEFALEQGLSAETAIHLAQANPRPVQEPPKVAA